MPQLRRFACVAAAVLALGVGAAEAKAPANAGAAAKPAAAKKAQPKAAAKPVKPKPAATKPAPVAAAVPATVAAPAAATDPNAFNLATVSGMASAGAPRIALDIMDRDQPDPAQEPAAWMAWERERIYIYQTSRAWKAVIQRAEKLPDGATPDFRSWETMQAADAWLHLGDGAKALALLQPLVWDAKHPPDERALADMRRLLIRSYTALGKLDDANTAVIRYRQDYPKDGGDWPLLEARLFLRMGQPEAALEVLEDVPGDEAEMLSLLASLRAHTLSPGDALGAAVKIGTDSKASTEKQVRAWLIAAEAADDLKNPVARISALQNAIGLQPTLIEQDDVFVLTPDMLWGAYIAYGQDLGNQLQLVVGDDQAWFVAASNLYDTQPVGAGALFSIVAYQAGDPKQAEVAQGQFAGLVQKQRYGDVLLRHLYLDSSRFSGPKTIPAEVRYLLVDDVLALPDIPLASELMQGLDKAPPAAQGDKTDPAVLDAAWQLKRAHVFILGGDPASGITSLHKLISTGAPIDVDEVLQVLFDLQTLLRDKEAIPLFEDLLKQSLAPEQRRQMLYWTADSYKAIEDYPKAAELYLRSAMLPDPFAMDQWAQTCRYQAAGMLAKAGYLEDARNLYTGLLNATRDPAQQAVLQHDLQQLMLLPMKPGGELH